MPVANKQFKGCAVQRRSIELLHYRIITVLKAVLGLLVSNPVLARPLSTHPILHMLLSLRTVQECALCRRRIVAGPTRSSSSQHTTVTFDQCPILLSCRAAALCVNMVSQATSTGFWARHIVLLIVHDSQPQFCLGTAKQ